MDNGASSYRRFRDDGDESGLAEIIRNYPFSISIVTSVIFIPPRNSLRIRLSYWVLRNPSIKVKVRSKHGFILSDGIWRLII